MSTITSTQSPSLTRPYIGSRRNRSYIHPTSTSSCLISSSLGSDSTSKALRSIRLDEKAHSTKSQRIETFQSEEEEQTSEKYLPFDERQPTQLQEKKTLEFLSTATSSSVSKPLLPLPSSSSPSTTSSSSSLFFFPTLHHTTPVSDYNQSSSSSASSPTSTSLVKEQQKFHHHHHHQHQHEREESDWHRLNRENKNNQLLLLEEKPEQEEEEEEKEQQRQQHQKRQEEKHLLSTNRLLSIPNSNFDLSEVPEENNSFSSSYSLSDTIIENNVNEQRSPRFTSTPTLPSSTSQFRSTNNKIFSSISLNKNPSKTSESLVDQSSTISTLGLISDLQRKADACQMNNMSSLSSSSSLRYSSNLGGTGTMISHPYDQRITDQGNKYIIQLKTDEYQEDDFTITPRYSTNQLIIDAKHREEDSAGGYIHRELHKIFNIPKHIDLNRYSHSYNAHNQELKIEMPYLPSNADGNRKDSSTLISTIHHGQDSSKFNYGNHPTNVSFRSDYHNDSNSTSGLGTTATDSTLMRTTSTAVAPTYESSIGKSKPFDFDSFHRSAFRPQIVRTTSNDPSTAHEEKKLVMSLDLRDYQAEDIKVSIKDRELIVQAERKVETDTRKSRTSFFQSTSLPPQTDVEHLQSNYIDGKLVIEAPYLESNRGRLQNTQGTQW